MVKRIAVLSLMSVSLCGWALVVVLWMRSYFTADGVRIRSFETVRPGVEDYREMLLASDGGQVIITSSRFCGPLKASDQFASATIPVVWETMAGTTPQNASIPFWRLFWFAFQHEHQQQPPQPPSDPFGYKSNYYAIVIPDWALLGLFSLLSLIHI